MRTPAMSACTHAGMDFGPFQSCRAPLPATVFANAHVTNPPTQRPTQRPTQPPTQPPAQPPAQLDRHTTKSLARAMPVVSAQSGGRGSVCVQFGFAPLLLSVSLNAQRAENVLHATLDQLHISAVQLQFEHDTYLFVLGTVPPSLPRDKQLLLLGQVLYVLERHAGGIARALQLFFSAPPCSMRMLRPDQIAAAERL